ncbi:hypothetical protein PUR21_16525 [Methylorubrum rhodesianum]|uniref:Uncharacterized protein n=1 Tax=Methylorubrum rhodesianum TaxID=29427 RepID=A0ABU9ZCS7_9HYPH
MAAYPNDDGYWITMRDGFYAVTSARGIEPGYEGIETYGDAQDHILDLQHRDLIAAQEEHAALDDFEAQHFAEAA